MVLFYVQHGLGVFRHLGGDPQHVPVRNRRAANLRLTFRLVLRILCLRRFWLEYLRMPSGREGADHLLFFMSSMALGVFRHLGGDPQHIPVGERRAANLCLTFRLALCYNIPSGGCAGLDWLPHEGGGCAGLDWLPHLFYWINVIQILHTVCGFRHVQRGLPDGVIFILNVRCPILPVVLAVVH